ncbi:MAG: hypothetical protein CBC07_006040 [Cellvibrionales bacterium TMED47]|nr:hypothetical protein [Porticoccaceae bacterium]RPG82423.1 MAG: hypothetical protein CBC07_006040 [Cellvibrionales bacterium TMED47]
MLAKRIGRLCTVLVLSGVSSVAVSSTLNWEEALQLVDQSGVVTIPEGYTSIGSEAFRGSNVNVVNLPSSLTHIESGAFKHTSQLEHITIPDSVTSIASHAFQYSAIKTIDLPESPLSIGQYAFDNSQLEHIRLSSGTNVEGWAFARTQLKSLWIGSDVSFGNGIFDGAISKLKTIVSYTDFDGEYNTVSSYRDDSNGTSYIYGMRGLAFESPPSNLEFFILRNAGITNANKRYHPYPNQDYSSSASATLVAEGNVSFGHDTKFNSALLVLPYISNIMSNLPDSASISACEPIDTDGDTYYDCYDQFPNDPGRWFDYGEESNSTPQFPSNDSDGDGILNDFDLSADAESCDDDAVYGEIAFDTDKDGVSNQRDCDDDNDGLIDIYEPFFGTNPLIPDSDFDGTLDGLDAFPLDNTESLDTDSDGIGNNADTDDDGDGHFDLLDAFPLDATEWMDSDLDGVGNNADTDDDNDGVLDEEDAFPYTASESVDTDGDGVGDNSDAFPNDSSETLDTDLDGIGNNADTDDDNDGVADADDSDPLNDSIGALESQNLFVMGNPVAVNGYLTTISVGYDVSDANNQLNGIGFRVHYDSSIYNYSAVQNTLSQSVVVDGMGPYQDVEDFDNDSTTESYILYGWAAVSGDWPNVELPAKLSDIEFFVNWADYDAASTTSNINFTVVDNNEGYDGEVTNYSMNVLPATWDFDGNGSGDALTDGLMLLRYTFGVTDLNMTTDVIAENATLSATQVVEGMTRALQITDIDGNGSTDALTDGLLLLRYMFGLRGDALISDTVSSDATRTSVTDIEQYIALYMPDGLTSPVQSEQGFLVGDWKLASVPEKRELNYNGIGEWTNDEYYGMNLETFNECVADDIYRFGNSGSFEYIINGSTYIHPDQNPFYSGGANYCESPLSPWNEDEVYSYTVDENNGELTVIGFGAYIALSQVADGNDEVDTPAEAPDSIPYSFTKLSEDQILFELDAYTAHFRFTLERVLGN